MRSVRRERPQDQEEYELTPEQEAEIEESIAELEHGEGIPLEEVLAEMREGLYGKRS